jgi:hypothetical protein
MGAAKVLLNGSITGGYLLKALVGFLKLRAMSWAGLFARRENS